MIGENEKIDIRFGADKAKIDFFWNTMYAHLCRYQCGHITIVELFSEWKRLLGITNDGIVEQAEVRQKNYE